MYCYFSDISMYLVTTPLNTLHFRLPFSSVQTRGSLSSDSCWCFFFSLFYAKFTVSDYAEKTQRWNKQMFCFVALCILYVLNLLLNGSENIKPFSVLCLHFTYSCSVISPSFLWKCHSARAAQRSEHTPFLTHCYCIVFMWNGSEYVYRTW